MMAPRRALRFLLAAATAAMASIPFYAAPGVGAAAPLGAKLAEFTPWIGPDETLRAGIDVTNHGADTLSRFGVTVQIHAAAGTRSALENSFRGKLGPLVISDTIPVEQTVAPGETQRLVIEKPMSEIRLFASNPDSGSYPVRLVVRSASASAAPIDTQLVFFSRPAPTPLGVVLVVPLHATAVYDPQMRIVSNSLSASVEHGAISAILDALDAHPGTPVTVAPSGLLLDTISDLADGFSLVNSSGTVQVNKDAPAALMAQRALDRIKTLAARDDIATIVSSYSQADLIWLSKAGLPERVQAQVGEAQLRARAILSKDPAPGWLLPPNGALDEATLAALSRAGFNRVIVEASSLPRFRGSFTRTAPVLLRSRSAGSVTALVTDTGLSSRLKPSSEMSAVQTRQRFLAETATIMLERPSEQRVATAVAPIGWSPEPALVDGVLLALHDSPWMRAVTPQGAVSGVKTIGSVEPLDAASILAAGREPPPESYLDTLRKARSAIDEYSGLGPPASRIRALEQNLMIAESADWWASRRLQSRGLAFAGAVVSTVRSEFAKIRAPAPQTITLTSRTGVIPLVVSTHTDYPVRVVIRLISDKLRFPGGTTIEKTLEPPAQTIDVSAVTEASGTFPLRVVVQTPNAVQISASSLRVRSTAYNLVALGITAGAGGFLVAVWIAGTIRRRLRH